MLAPISVRHHPCRIEAGGNYFFALLTFFSEIIEVKDHNTICWQVIYSSTFIYMKNELKNRHKCLVKIHI